MALHRDIYWVGRQWAVTGYGIQAVDPKLKGQFDIEASRLWEDGLSDSLNAGAWLNGEDFAKALSVARARYPQSLRWSLRDRWLHNSPCGSKVGRPNSGVRGVLACGGSGGAIHHLNRSIAGHPSIHSPSSSQSFSK